MKTITRFLSDIISETFEKADPAAWKDAPAYRPGPLMVPVDTRKTGPPPARLVPGQPKK